jgi:hypothetical protein
MNVRLAGLALACALLLAAAESTPLARQLDEVARIGSVMVDGDVCERIVTSRAMGHLLRTDPRDQWAAADNFDVNHDAYTSTKKTLIRLARLGPPHMDVNLWMPVPGEGSRVQILIRNVNEVSQFWKWGDLHQPATPEMKRVMTAGERIAVTQRPGFISVLAPVKNSLGDIVAFIEAVAQTKPDLHGNVK